MIILIDAYNVLKQSSYAEHISEAQRAAFIKKLSRYAAIKGHTIIAVFDGGDSARPFEEKKGAVRIIYSGHATNADTVLKQLCAQFKHLQAVMVSSDREVCSYARLHDISCIEAVALYDLLQGVEDASQSYHREHARGQVRKRAGHESSSELDALMQESAEQMLIKQEDYSTDFVRKSPTKMVSKAEKKIKKLVNKL